MRFVHRHPLIGLHTAATSSGVTRRLFSLFRLSRFCLGVWCPRSILVHALPPCPHPGSPCSAGRPPLPVSPFLRTPDNPSCALEHKPTRVPRPTKSQPCDVGPKSLGTNVPAPTWYLRRSPAAGRIRHVARSPQPVLPPSDGLRRTQTRHDPANPAADPPRCRAPRS